MPIGSDNKGAAGAVTTVTGTVGAAVGGVSRTVGGVGGALGRGVGETINASTASAKHIAASSSLQNTTGTKQLGNGTQGLTKGVEDGAARVAKGVEDGSQGKKVF